MSGRVRTGFKAFLVTFFIVGWIGFLFGMVVAKETPKGAVSGLVVHRDQEVYKGIVAGARVTLSGSEVTLRTTSDAKGNFKFAEVPTGSYWLSSESPHLELTDTLPVEVYEAKIAKAKPLVMRTRPPYVGATLNRNVFMPGEQVKLNVRGYSPSADSVHISLHRLNARSMFMEGGMQRHDTSPPSHYAEKTPIAEWDEPIKRDYDGDFDRQVTLPAQPEGGYFFRVKMGDLQSEGWFTVTRIALVTKRSLDKMLAYCVDFETRKPLPGVSLSLYYGGEWRPAATDSSGLYSASGDQIPYEVLAQIGDSLAYSGADYYRDPDPYQGLIYTDRPVYRPGHLVYFKGILRERAENFYRNMPDQPLAVDIMEPSGKLVKHLDLTTNRFGTFNGAYQLPDEPPLGRYMIRAKITEEEGVSGSFEVAEYRKPDFMASISFDKKYFVAGTTIKGEVQASYYFGSPVTDATVRYTVYKSPAYLGYDFGDEFFDDFYGDLEENYHENEYGYGELVLEGEGKTDAEGRFRLNIPTDRYQESDFSYTVEVNITDQSLRTNSASAGVMVPKGLFRLQASTEDYIYRPGTPVKVEIKAEDYDDRPKSNVQVKVSVDERRWEGTEERQQLRYRRITDGQVTTGPDGKATYSFTPTKEGDFRIRVEARDRLDNLIHASTVIWIASEDFASDNYRGAELEIVRDKKIYQVGDTARIIINSSVKDVYALLTIEGRELFDHRLVHLKNNSTVVDLPALREYVPNAFISVCYVDGKNFVSRDVPFYVSPEFKFLNVSITFDKDVYKPGDTATYVVKTTDLKGKPVSAEVSLGIVDESIYAIMEDRTPDMRKHFYSPQWNSVSTSYSFPDYYMGGSDKDGFSGKVRKYFPDTAYWSPDIVTGPDGQASVTVPIPDSLTTWRATARAVTADTDVGSAVQKVRATKDLIVRLQTPRFITQKDELAIGATLHNYTDRSQQVKLWLDVKGLKLEGNLRRTVTIEPNKVMRFEWPVNATTAGTANLTIYAQGDTDSDAMELEVPILPHGLNRIDTANGSVDQEDEATLRVNDGAIPETVKMEVMLTPTAAGAMLGSLNFLKDYEYGCMEQTTSRFVPWLSVANAFRALGSPDPDIEKRLPDLVKPGLERVYSFQNKDGGWGWWHDESSPYTTAYVVYGLTVARSAGFAVNSASLERGLTSLDAQVTRLQAAVKVKTPDEPPYANPTERIYMLYSLALNGRANPDHVADIMKERKKLTSYGKALLALTLYEMDNREWADKVTGELDRESKYFKGMRHWEVDEKHWRWEDDSVEATAYVLRAMLRRDPADPRIEETVRWLTMKRSGTYWLSTKQTAAVVYALAESITKRAELVDPQYTVEVFLNGRSQGRVSVTKANILKQQFTLPMKNTDVRTGNNTITIRKSGTGPLYYSAVVRYYSLEEDIQPRSSGLKVKREYFRLDPERRDDGSMEMKPKPLGGRADIAEEIICRLTIESNDNYHYVVIEDPRPAGWEPVEQLSDVGYYGGFGGEYGDWAPWTTTEIRDEKVAIFATRLPKGKWTTEYRMRAEIPGQFHSLPTTAYGMYAPQINGNGPEKRIVVRQ